MDTKKTILWTTVPAGVGSGPNALKLSVVASPAPSLAGNDPATQDAQVLADWKDWNNSIFDMDKKADPLRLGFYLQFGNSTSSKTSALFHVDLDKTSAYATPEFLPSKVSWEKVFPVEYAPSHQAKQIASVRKRVTFAETSMTYSSTVARDHIQNRLIHVTAAVLKLTAKPGRHLAAAVPRMSARELALAQPIETWLSYSNNESWLGTSMSGWIRGVLGGADRELAAWARRIERNLYRLTDEPWIHLKSWALYTAWDKTVPATKQLKALEGFSDFREALDDFVLNILPYVDVNPATQSAFEVALFYGRVRRKPNEAADTKNTDLTDVQAGRDAVDNAPPPNFAQKILMLNNYPMLQRKLGLIFDLVLQNASDIDLASYDRVRTVAFLDGAEYGWSPWTALNPSADPAEFLAAANANDRVHKNGLVDSSALMVDGVEIGASIMKMTSHAQSGDSFNPGDNNSTVPSPVSNGITIYLAGRSDIVAGKIASRQDPKNFSGDYAPDSVLNAQPTTVPVFPGSNDIPPNMFASTVVPGFENCQYYDDLVRGYVPFVKTNGPLKSLCARTEKYVLGKDGTETWSPKGQWTQGDKSPLKPYGCVATSTTTTHDFTNDGAADDPRDPHTHEAIIHWTGWSLVAPPPKFYAAIALADPYEPDGTLPASTSPDGVYGPAIRAEFEAVGLPDLRFETDYKFAVPCMDVAGFFRLPENSDLTLGYNNLRYDPVLPPDILLMDHLSSKASPGEQLTRLIIRSGSDQSQDSSLRVVVPPRCSIRMAEQCKMFDPPYAAPHDTGSFAEVRLLNGQAQFPVDPSEMNGQNSKNPFYQAPQPFFERCQYLPDPYAEGFLLEVTDTSLPDKVIDKPQPFYSFYPNGRSWPEAAAWVVVIVPQEKSVPNITVSVNENYFVVKWLRHYRAVIIHLPLGRQAEIKLRSYINPDKKKLMKVIDLIQGRVDGMEVANANPDTVAPHRQLSASHAVAAPVYGTRGPNDPPGLIVTPAARKPGDTNQNFTKVASNLDLPSTGKVKMSGTWVEWVDKGPGTAPPVKTNKSALVFDSSLPAHLTGAKSQLASGDEFFWTEVNFPLPKTDGTPGANITHEFGDTRHRFVTYTISGSGRLADCFNKPASTEALFASCNAEIHSTGSCPAPVVSHIVPTFRWLNILPEKSNPFQISRQRKCGSCRIWLKRPWYVTGMGEKLGVIVWKRLQDVQTDVKSDRMATSWGADPLWLDATKTLVPTKDDFESYDSVVDFPQYDPNSPEDLLEKYSLVLFEPKPDLASDMWYVDVRFKSAPSYFSFLQLSLVRYQGNAVPGRQASPIYRAPFIQLPPDRIVSVQLQGATLKVTLADPLSKARTADDSECVLAVQRPWLTAARRDGWKAPQLLMPKTKGSVPGLDGQIAYWETGIERDDLGATKLSVYEYEHFKGENMYPPSDDPDGPISVLPDAAQPPKRLVFADTLTV